MTELDLLKTEVHAKGFNISMMINLFKKKQRERGAKYVIPDSVYCAVCREYLTKKAVERNFPYFMRVLVRKAEEDCVNRNRQMAELHKFGKMPESLKGILKGMAE